ncbi:hypothetical protein GPL17_19035 [Bradyrhizobium yuanmingense]|uniref:hypothetical protein n=1 Tax=Bradyrhizobium yuanmingense TaxID=108015 RepID=UPI0012FA9188|nr:hypothetical protein [Bradyrhizobium yuanmingense]MVT52579.1 hypothetical protein [Bradyrhizobium yuanmingense]
MDMDRRGRQAFMGDIAPDLRLATTRHDAPQAHTIAIATNMLDLFGTADPSLGGPDRKVLYHDASQIHALPLAVLPRSGHRGGFRPSPDCRTRRHPLFSPNEQRRSEKGIQQGRAGANDRIPASVPPVAWGKVEFSLNFSGLDQYP